MHKACYIIFNEDGDRVCITNHDIDDECDLDYTENKIAKEMQEC